MTNPHLESQPSLSPPSWFDQLRHVYEEATFVCLHLLPKNLISMMTGHFVRIRWPQSIGRWLNRLFVGVFRIQMAEAAHPLEAYTTIEEVFTRTLAPNQRPIDIEPVSPADGTLSVSQALRDGHIIQAKGLWYEADELIGRPSGSEVSWAWATTVYLAPHNYHRVHAPVTGKVVSISYLPGELWPVNKSLVSRLPRLFVRNERLVFELAWEGGGTVFLVMVGAFNVGRMVTPLLPDLVTNSGGSVEPRQFMLDRQIGAGDELGTFMLGSTVVLVWDQAAATRAAFKPSLGPQPVVMGQSLVTREAHSNG
jgi:phosphatidylserine decarboxylase